MDIQNINQAGKSDIELLASLIRQAFADVAERFGLTEENAPTHPSLCQPEWVSSAMDKGVIYYLLTEEDRPVGCVALEQAGPEVCYLERLAVIPEKRGQGLGACLVVHVLDEARRLGAERVEIAIIAEQTNLRTWYERKGFSFVRRQRFDHLPFTVDFLKIIL